MKQIMQSIRALVNRTFVTSCPVCHKEFYGFHEYEENVVVNGKNYRIICHRCAKNLKELK